MAGFILSLAFASTAFLGPTLALTFGPIWSYFSIFTGLLLVPLLDLVLPRDARGSVRGPNWFFDGILFTYAVMHLLLVLWGAWFVAQPAVGWSVRLGTILSMGLVSGAIGVIYAHELIHRKGRGQRLMGEGILVLVSFGHFAVAHVHGHHRYVATPKDPATALKGQSVYSFFITAIPGVLKSALEIKPRATLVYSILSLLIWVFLTLAFGIWAGVFFLCQSLLAILLTEITDYIEHYGLVRKAIGPDRYEPVSVHHSWDSDCWLSGKLLIHLQRHSDHHTHAAKPYAQLNLVENPRQLPTGYAGCLILALVPPLWRKVMDPRIP